MFESDNENNDNENNGLALNVESASQSAALSAVPSAAHEWLHYILNTGE